MKANSKVPQLASRLVEGRVRRYNVGLGLQGQKVDGATVTVYVREDLIGRVFKIASKSYAFFAYSIDAFDYQVRRKVFNRPFLNMAVSSILQPFFEFEVNSSVLVG